MRISLLFFLLIFFTGSLFAGKFEHFCDEFEFIRKHLEKNKAGGRKIADRQGILDRAMQAASDASDIQQRATEIGIRNITIGNDFFLMCRAFPVLGGNQSKSTASVRWKYVDNIRRQTQLLKSMKFNYEKRTFVRLDGSGTGRMDALEKLEMMLQDLEKEIKKNKSYSKGMQTWFQTKHDALHELATKIDTKARNDRLRLSASYDLPFHARQYTEGLKKYFENRRKTSDKGRASSSTVQQYVYTRDCILEDINILRKAGFEMLIMDQPSVAPARGNSQNSVSDPFPAVRGASSPQGSLQELVRELDARKERAFRSERRMNGVSRRYYEQYRSLLTKSQAESMDEAYRKSLELQYPPELARADAVLKAHTKYRGIWKGATVQEVQALLSKGE